MRRMNTCHFPLKQRGYQSQCGLLFDGFPIRFHKSLKQKQMKKSKKRIYPEIEANEIIDGLYLGGINTAYNIKHLKKLGITTIINVAIDADNMFEDKFKYLNLYWHDVIEQNIILSLDAITTKIHNELKEGNKVLVHCIAGISRSASVIIAYLIKYHKMTFYKAFNHVKSKRKIIQPNVGFINQLKLFDLHINTLKS